LKLNSFSDRAVAWFTKITCPCWWKKFFNK
jgi:hypothetical protein